MKKEVIESNVIEYNDIKSISGFTCIVSGEDENSYYEKEFRYSADKILWSDYTELTNKNLSKVVVYDGKLYVQYRFTKVGINELSVESISLDVEYNREYENPIPECFWSKGKTMPQIIYNQNGLGSNIFNPYAIGQSMMIYRQMSTLISNMFGICVLYFKTEANSRSRDVVLKEYSIEKVIDKQSIKVLIPDNQLPTRELQFNTMMIDYPVQFEVHIVKSEFQKVFGEDSHPDPHDYLYFQTYMNKMYMVDSVSDPDDFGYVAAYWRVSLVPYQEMKSVQYETDDLLEDTNSIIFSAEGKFKEEMDDEIADNRKDNQLNDVGILEQGQDPHRRILSKSLKIVDESIYNNWTVIAKTHYNLSSIDRGEIAVEYDYAGISSDDERMITFAFRATNSNNISDNIMIDSISEKDGKVQIKVRTWNKLLDVGNIVKISRVSGLKEWYSITAIDRTGKTIELNCDYDDGIRLMSCGKLVSYESNYCLCCGDGFDVIQLPGKMGVRINGRLYQYAFDGISDFDKKWYFCCLGINKRMTNMWLYEIDGSETVNNSHGEMKRIGVSSNLVDEFSSEGYFNVKGGNLHLTNIRLWSKLCEEDLQTLIMSEFVVDDTHNTLIVDNAQNELMLNYKWGY